MDNQSSDSDKQIDIHLSQTKKPINRNFFQHNCLKISSQFPGGNLRSALFQDEFRMGGKIALVIQFWGNSDAQCDALDKSWFNFQVSGIRQFAKLNYEEIIFRFKNANNLRKFIREKKFRPYIVYKQNPQLHEEQWRTIFISKINVPQTQIIEAQFVYPIKQNVDCVQFAENLPYMLSDLEQMHENILTYLEQRKQKNVYYNRQIIAQSIDGYPIYMCTITSMRNVEINKISEIQSNQIFKNRPEIVITSRVHPSETSSSYCVEGIIESLIENEEFQFLSQLFIFRIMPMINPDGVQNGHYRLDNYLQNLNRYYGHSDLSKTPSVYAIQRIITNLREKSKLFLFMDIHGHNSPKHSFVFGNFCQNIYQVLENKAFVKILQIVSPGNFDYVGCEFSKKNMTVKQKYDEHSKEASARVFAYRGNSQQQNNQQQNKSVQFVEHSYTLQIHPYVLCQSNLKKNMTKKMSKEMSGSNKNLLKNANTLKTNEQIVSCPEISEKQIVQQYKKIGEGVLVSILELIGANTLIKLKQSQDSFAIRKKLFKEISKSLEYYDRSKKIKLKEVNKQLLERYFQKWNFIQTYKQYLEAKINNQQIKQRLKFCPLNYFYEQWLQKRDKMEQLNLKRMRILQRKQKPLSMRESQGQQQNEEKQDNLRSTNQNGQSEIRKTNGSAENNKKINVLKTKEFELVQKIENKNINSFKKTKTPQINQIEQLERKIRKLMFRHRTQIQIPDEETNDVKYETLGDKLDKRFEEDYIKSRKITINQKLIKKKVINTNKLQPLGKIEKVKISHIRTQQNAPNHYEFNDYTIAEGRDRRTFQTIKRADRLQSLKPRIEQFVKKLSQHKNDLEAAENDREKQDNIQVKSTGISLQKKKNSRCSYQYLREAQKIQSRDSEVQCPVCSNQTIEPKEVKNTTKIYDDMNSASLLKARLTGCHKSLKSKLQSIEATSNANQQEIQNIVKSFRVLAGEGPTNKRQFLQKAKNILSEKKKPYKTIEETYLPIISDIEYTGTIKRFTNKTEQ